MLGKIQILYPNVSLIELIERFFLTYLTWLENYFKLNLNKFLRNYSIPIRLNDKIIPNENDIINVLSPTFPEHNLARKIDKTTIKIIEKAMLEGLKTIRDIRNEIRLFDKLINPWNKWMEPKKFSEM
uniref:PAP_central domain-containing protein n=1 Tax=Meloidogyne hapla TaxID=6305 RepID=A0A1I8BI74_MELHA